MKISVSEMNIAFFVSDHGFGHAARATAVMMALRRLSPKCQLEIFSRVPEWFFSEILSPSIRYHGTKTDVGMVQNNPFAADFQATILELDDFLPFRKSEIRSLTAILSSRGCKAVVCDISSLGIAVVDGLGVPSILVENFTWDWIYAPYFESFPAFRPHAERLCRWYDRATVHLQTEPVCRPMPGVRCLNPISRAPKNGREKTRGTLGLSGNRPLVLLTMGGVTGEYGFVEKLEKYASVTFVVPHNVSHVSRHGNVISLPKRSDFYHPDLVAAADLVIGKLGYSTLAEVGHAGKPFGYILREESAETEVLGAYAGEHIRGEAISESEFSSGRWLDDLDRFLELGTEGAAFPNDADVAAEIVLEAASCTDRIESRLPITVFDPFNDRRSRDVRNRLSETFVTAIRRRDPQILEHEVVLLMGAETEAAYRAYIQYRQRQYRQVLGQISKYSPEDHQPIAICIWNAGLFFECHEYLEHYWLNAAGDERIAIQALIKSAGAFVHRTLGREVPARRLSAKALFLVESSRERLSFIRNLEDLIMSLKNQGADAPKLEGKGLS